MKVLKIDPIAPESEKIQEASDIILNGGIIGYPTETVYGLGCDAFNHAAIKRLYSIKRRDLTKPMSVIIHSQLQLCQTTKAIPEVANKLIQKFWPGPLTLVLLANPRLQPLLVGAGNTIAVRIPANQICLSLLSICQVPLVSTSANLSGTKELVSPGAVLKVFLDKLDLLIDGGPTISDVPSTIVDCTGKNARLLRAGAIPVDSIEHLIGPLSVGNG